MEQVKIKRIKRDKKPVTTQGKILAGLGVAGTIMGGASAMAPSAQAQNIVSSQTNEQSTATSKVKAILNKVFGSVVGAVSVPKAKADDGDGPPTSGSGYMGDNIMSGMINEFAGMQGGAGAENNASGSNAGLANNGSAMTTDPTASTNFNASQQTAGTNSGASTDAQQDEQQYAGTVNAATNAATTDNTTSSGQSTPSQTSTQSTTDPSIDDDTVTSSAPVVATVDSSETTTPTPVDIMPDQVTPANSPTTQGPTGEASTDFGTMTLNGNTINVSVAYDGFGDVQVTNEATGENITSQISNVTSVAAAVSDGQTPTVGAAQPTAVLNYGTTATPTQAATQTDSSGNITAVNLNYPTTATTVAPTTDSSQPTSTSGTSTFNVGQFTGTITSDGTITGTNSNYNLNNFTSADSSNPASPVYAADENGSYAVQPGNTVSEIALFSGRTQNQIDLANGASNSANPNTGSGLNVVAGQDITIPSVSFVSNDNGQTYTEQVTTADGSVVTGQTYSVANTSSDGSQLQLVSNGITLTSGTTAIILGQMADNNISQINGIPLSGIADGSNVSTDVATNGSSALATITPFVPSGPTAPTNTADVVDPSVTSAIGALTSAGYTVEGDPAVGSTFTITANGGTATTVNSDELVDMATDVASQPSATAAENQTTVLPTFNTNALGIGSTAVNLPPAPVIGVQGVDTTVSTPGVTLPTTVPVTTPTTSTQSDQTGATNALEAWAQQQVAGAQQSQPTTSTFVPDGPATPSAQQLAINSIINSTTAAMPGMDQSATTLIPPPNSTGVTFTPIEGTNQYLGSDGLFYVQNPDGSTTSISSNLNSAKSSGSILSNIINAAKNAPSAASGAVSNALSSVTGSSTSSSTGVVTFSNNDGSTTTLTPVGVNVYTDPTGTIYTYGNNTFTNAQLTYEQLLPAYTDPSNVPDSLATGLEANGLTALGSGTFYQSGEAVGTAYNAAGQVFLVNANGDPVTDGSGNVYNTGITVNPNTITQDGNIPFVSTTPTTVNKGVSSALGLLGFGAFKK